MKKAIFLLLKITLGLLLFWGLLTLVVQTKGKAESQTYGEFNLGPNAIVVYDPDPFYNLDQQICESVAKGLEEQNWKVKVMTVAAAEKITDSFDLYVFCANTYNWAPDRAIRNYIRAHEQLEGQAAVAITLGSGSTARAKRLLEQELNNKNTKLLISRTFWLMRPNDESRMEESNIDVAVAMAKDMVQEVLKKYGKQER